jgi:hypothetical protein
MSQVNNAITIAPFTRPIGQKRPDEQTTQFSLGLINNRGLYPTRPHLSLKTLRQVSGHVTLHHNSFRGSFERQRST